ncbi:MAG: hypothetical protein JWR38_5262 [Mucilaginibacter sp.]|nr:hypothetical protein [Mucilaginibacter sp.]
MSTVIDIYKIQFVKKFLINEYIKTISSPNSVLDQFITDYRTPNNVNNFLLSEINNVLNGISSAETLISESMISVIVSSNISKFYQDPDYSVTDNPDYSMPTQDLKEIAEAWMSYLASN